MVKINLDLTAIEEGSSEITSDDGRTRNKNSVNNICLYSLPVYFTPYYVLKVVILSLLCELFSTFDP